MNANAITLPAIHDAASIQQALSVVIEAVAEGTLDNTRARVLLSALKLAMTNLRNLPAEAKSVPAEDKGTQHHERAAVTKAPAATASVQERAYDPRNNRIPAIPAAPAFSHADAFARLTPPSA
ncbi:MAG: hypothetical protein JST61_09345 [Acidobacteria bacterium]|nr:hypothetical protein [Acidobacteriota bacterium]